MDAHIPSPDHLPPAEAMIKAELCRRMAEIAMAKDTRDALLLLVEQYEEMASRSASGPGAADTEHG